MKKATSDKTLTLYAPKLEYFAKHFSYPRVPSESFKTYEDMLKTLGRVQLYYCANFQSKSCANAKCNFHHLCEWCGYNHPGNECNWRPSNLPLRWA